MHTAIVAVTLFVIAMVALAFGVVLWDGPKFKHRGIAVVACWAAGFGVLVFAILETVKVSSA